MAVNKKKYENTILYLAKELGGKIKGKKKLAKLLYFVDFDNFEKNQRPVTGDQYKAIPMGPMPLMMNDIVEDMRKRKVLRIRKLDNIEGYLPTTEYEVLRNPNMKVFSKEEAAILNRVVKKYGQLNGNELGDITHNQAPYIGTRLSDIVDYELAFYRDTDFSDD